MRQARNPRFVPPASIGPDTASQRAQEDALRAQEERDLQEAIHNSRITAQEEQRLREEERQREQRQHQALMPQPEPAAPEPQQPAPEADQGIARNVDERSWYEAGEIVKEYRNANGGRPPSVAHVVAQLQARLGITAVQAQNVCDEMGLF